MAHESIEYVHKIFQPDDYVLIVLIHNIPTAGTHPPKFPVEVKQYKVSALSEKIVETLQERNAAGWHIYVCMNAFAQQKQPYRRRKQDVSALRTCYIELDYEGDAGLAKINSAVAAKEIPEPHFVLQSSPHKFHVVWKIDGIKEYAIQEELNRALQIKFGGDAAAIDCSRVLRLPGFRNTKAKYLPDLPLVFAVQRSETPRSALGDFKQLDIKPVASPPPLGDPVSEDRLSFLFKKIENVLTRCKISPEPWNQVGDGEWRCNVRCPNSNTHSDGRLGAMLFLYADGHFGFKCLHGHNCPELNWKSMLDWMKTQLPGENLNDLGPPARVYDCATVAELRRPDMPESVLCGYLGELCRTRLADFPIAYSWPSILAAASVLVKPHPEVRCNLYVALVGEVESGKSQAQERAHYYFGLSEQGLLLVDKFGSGEGLLETIGDHKGAPVYWYPDELSHVMTKAQIQGASLPYILNTMFYKDVNNATVSKRKPIAFNARVTLAGGIVEKNFGDSFGSATTAGLYSRFLFGLCPTGYCYSYRPIEGPQLFEASQSVIAFDCGAPPKAKHIRMRETPHIHRDVWTARDQIKKNENIDGRLLELVLRTALVSAAWDDLPELRASYLEPAWEFARYQQRIRAVLKPNPGLNFEAVAGYKMLDYLQQHSVGGKWHSVRDVRHATRVLDLGPSVADRALASMVAAGEIELGIEKRPNGGPPKRLIRLAVEAG
jgi:hypothetical protein